MSALSKYRDQIRIAKQTGNFVVQTVDEAQAVIEEIEGPKFGVIVPDSGLTADDVRELFSNTPANVVPVWPHEDDDDHAH